MKKSMLLSLLTSLVIPLPGASFLEAETTHTIAPIKQLTPDEARADFDLLRKALEEAHTGLYRYSTKAEMDRTFDTERARLNRPLMETEFLAVTAEMLATIKCGHTGCEPGEATKAAIKETRLFPLRVLLEGPRLMVLLNDTPDNPAIRPGMEIVEINGHKASDIVSRFMPLLSGDGDVETGKRHDIVGKFSQLYWTFVEQTSDFTVKAIDTTGHTVIAKLAGVTDAERKVNKNPVNDAMLAGIGKLMEWPKENQSLRFLKEEQIAEIRLRYFVGDDFRRWVEATFKTLREKRTESLIIDLRGNGGGEDMFGALLVSYLTDKPFHYFDHIDVKTFTPTFTAYSDWNVRNEDQLREGMTPNPAGGYFVKPQLHGGVAEQSSAEVPFLGKVFILTDGGTFSTGADFCAITHHLKRATFIGEETGGGYYGNNSGMDTILTLPNSKVRIGLPMYEYWNAVSGYDGKRRGTIPDHIVPLTTADILRGVDAQLDLALRLATTHATSK